MNLYRLCYIRAKRPRSVTFSAADLIEALRFMENWERWTGFPVLTMKPEGRSKISSICGNSPRG